MQRSISPISLLFASVSAILGSGWLFSAFYVSEQAGPAAILSWLIGGGAIIIVAFVFAELSAMIPVTGSSTRIPQFTHGTIVSFLFSLLIWIAYAALVPTETQAIIQYLDYFFPMLTKQSGGLTQHGFILATVIMLIISAVNIFSLRWLLRANSFLTILKIAIPVIVSIILISLYFSIHNTLHPADTKFMPFGFHGLLAAITTGGIIFAFNGFKQACEMAGEAKNPKRTLPLAIIGSVGITLAIYLLLQVALLDSLTLKDLQFGWAKMQLGTDTSPFATIIGQDHLHVILVLVYIGAIIGPLAAALMYANSASRSLFGQSKNGYLPLVFQRLTIQGNPIYAITLNFLFGMVMFMPLPGWDKMVSFLTSIMGITYAIAPISLIALRAQMPDYPRPFKLPFPKTWSFVAFYICNLISYWSGWNIISKLSIILIAGLIVLFSYHFFTKRGRKIEFHWLLTF